MKNVASEFDRNFYLFHRRVLINGDKYFIKEGFKVISKNSVHYKPF